MLGNCAPGGPDAFAVHRNGRPAERDCSRITARKVGKEWADAKHYFCCTPQMTGIGFGSFRLQLDFG
jgi:hypothetical protein